MHSKIYGLATSKKVKFAQRQAPSENRVSELKFRQKPRTSIKAPQTFIFQRNPQWNAPKCCRHT